MQILVLRAVLATSLLSLVTGCASLQADGPPEEPIQDLVLPEDDGIDLPVRLDYIDDRFDRSIRQISFLAGARDFTDRDLWGRVDAEVTLGLEYAHEVQDGIGFELGGVASLGTETGANGGVDVTGAAAEIYGGGRYWFKNDQRRWTPYVGAGLSMVLAGVDNDAGGQVADDQDFTLGFYAHGGVQYDLNDALFLGLDLRTLLGTDLELETISGDADYWQLGLVLGFRL